MSVEIVDTAVVDSFKTKLSEFDFIEDNHKAYILDKIDIFLDKNKARYQKALVAGEIWKLLVFGAIKAFSKNTRGFSELCNYIDSYIKYENLLFAIDEQYRDHMIHSIWVMMVGIFIRNKYDIFCDLDYSRHLMPMGKDSEVFNELIIEIRKYETPLWCLIALTHDLGYPIEKTKLANKIMADMINQFGFLKQTDFDYNFTVVHQTTIEALLNILSSRMICDVTKGEKLYKVVRMGGSETEYAKSFEKLDHGIMSAYLLQKYLDFICEYAVSIVGSESVGFIEEEEVAKTVLIWSLLSAITIHTSTYSYSHKIDDMGCCLILCDELEEFSRYSRESMTNEWKEVSIRTKLECSPESLELEYTFDKDLEDIKVKDFFEEKVMSINNHFDVDEDGLKMVKVVCKDIAKADEILYIFENEYGSDGIKAYCVIEGTKKEELKDFISKLVGYRNCSVLIKR